MKETINFIEQSILKSKNMKLIFTPNVDHLMLARKDQEFKKAYENADLTVPDGVPIVFASRIYKNKLKQRVNGTDLIHNLSDLSGKKGYSIFFLGGKKDIAKKTSEILKHKFKIKIAGYHSPSFNINKKETESIINKINNSKSDILLVGLGPPKQEKWLYYNKDKIKAKIGIGIGGSFDIISGNLKRAPLWMQNYGLEWLFRLIQEPKRLWKRYLIRDIVFPFILLKESFNKEKE